MHHLGFTRSVICRDYLLHTSDAFVRTPLPEIKNGLAIVHVAPQMGARFAMTTVELEAGGTLGAGPAQRFVYVLAGEVALEEPSAAKPHLLGSGGFAFLPTDYPHRIAARSKATLVMFEKPLFPLSPVQADELDAVSCAKFLIGTEDGVQSGALNGDHSLQVRTLLPASVAFDFAVNSMSYAPGASLSQVEVHWMEHGLLMLEGSGIYRLGSDWHPVEAGDAIWMASFCPQWFAALGKRPAKYLIYKDFNRHVLG